MLALFPESRYALTKSIKRLPMDKVVHFEIPYDRKDRASKFYSEIFGWKLMDVPEMDYTLVYAAETDENHMVAEKGAINGGMFLRNDEAKQPMIVIGVKSIDDTIRKVVAAGGKVVTPKQPIPNGSYARIADCEGNIIGLADSSR
jgi:predicted enzyme related to lactoylglutathione lyase